MALNQVKMDERSVIYMLGRVVCVTNSRVRQSTLFSEQY